MLNLNGGASPAPAAEALVVRDVLTDRAGALLDELDTLISELGDALADADAARRVIADAETEMEMIAASLTLATEGRNDEMERKARLALALRADAGYRSLAQTVRHARASLLPAERRATLVRQRIALVRAALALLGHDGGGGHGH